MTVVKYDWKHIRIQYVQGRENGEGLLEHPTLEQLAQDYSIPPQTVRSRAAREHWTQLRHEFSTLLQQKSQDLTLERLAERVASVNINVFNVASAGVRLLGQRLLRLSQEGEVSLEEHQHIATALATYYRVVRLATNQEGA
jgi:anti-sigma factor RsiW